MDTKRLRTNCQSFDTAWLTEIEERFESILDDLDDFNDRLGKLDERIEKVETVVAKVTQWRCVVDGSDGLGMF